MRRSLFISFFIAATLLASGVLAAGQTAQMRGSVKLIGPDGKPVAVAGAQIDVYRTDISGEYHTKSDKKGEWVFAGLPLAGTYIVAISAPGAAPYAVGGIRVLNDQPVNVNLTGGDGRRLTLAEAKVAAAGGSNSSASSSSSDKAKAEEIAKKNAELAAENEKVKNANEALTEIVKNGNAALNAKNYDEAIKQYDSGLNGYPDHPAVRTLLTNKSVALRARGVDKFNAAIQSKDDAAKKAGIEAAKADFTAAADAANRAVDLAKKEPAATDPEAQKQQAEEKLLVLSSRAEAMRLFVTKVDPTKVDDASAAYEEYLAVETDPGKKSKVEMDYAQMLFDTNSYDKAKAEYEKILTATPDNPDALANMGLIYFNAGAMKEAEGKKDEAKPLYQQAANFLQRFVDKAPEGHKFKADAKAVLEEMKNQQNVQAEKNTNTNTNRRKRP